MELTIYDLILSLPVLLGVFCIENDPYSGCKYTVRMPEASWHTAYNVCEQNNQTLAEITSLSEMEIMEILLTDVDNLFDIPFINLSASIWVGGFMRTSGKDILTRNCTSLNFSSAINVSKTEFTVGIACLYYERRERQLYTDNCEKMKPFICEKKEEGPSFCMETSLTESIKDRPPHNLCSDSESLYITSTECESRCLNSTTCYTLIMSNDSCTLLRYKNDSNCSLERPPVSRSLRHKSIFKILASDYPAADPQNFTEWCPAPKESTLEPKVTTSEPVHAFSAILKQIDPTLEATVTTSEPKETTLEPKEPKKIPILENIEPKETTLEPKKTTLEPKEPKKIIILGENNCNVPKRKSSENYLISRGWELISIFNDPGGTKKSKIAVVFDDDEDTCFTLPTQEDFTPFLMMSLPTEPVFGIQAKAFVLNISGIGISCDRHSNARMLQVSYRAIKEPTQFCTLTDNKAVPDAFSSCVFRCDCPDPAHCREVNLYLASGNAKGAWSLCEMKATTV